MCVCVFKHNVMHSIHTLIKIDWGSWLSIMCSILLVCCWQERSRCGRDTIPAITGYRL